MGKILGIDLGTCNSAVAIMEGKETKVIVNSEGARTTPSVVGFQDNGEVVVGQLAKRQAVINPLNTISSVKRFIGRRFDECAEDIKHVSYKVVRATNGDAAIEINGKQHSPQEISAKILQKLKKAAEDYLGENVTEAVITVPHFNDAQRQATKDAGRIAGLSVRRIINEPTSASLSYSLDQKNEQLIAVYDFGGGTCDISILEVGGGVIQVLSTHGDTHLGGDDCDQKIVDWLISEFKKDSGMDVSKDKMVIQRLKDAAEQAKIELSNVQETTINLPFLTADATGPKHLQKQLTRAKFEQMIRPLVDKTFESVKMAMKDAGKTVDQINEVVLVGGSTRIPLVQEEVKKYWNKDPHKGVNPDEVVAIGAALQGAVLTGEIKDLVLLDVTPLSLSLETLGGVSTVMVPRNSTIPMQKKEIFSTAADNQPSVELHILQGERVEAKHNRTLGRFVLEGIMPAPRGVPKVEVTFDIDAGILSVTAMDSATQRQQKITITASGGLSEADIKRMVDEAKEHEAEDKQLKEETEARNRLDNLCFSVDKMLTDNADKVSSSDKEKLQSLLVDARQAVESRDAGRVKAAQESLEKEVHRVSEAMYSAAQNASPPAPEAPPADSGSAADGGQSKVVDAEFEEVK